jgi:hypothetical protein
LKNSELLADLEAQETADAQGVTQLLAHGAQMGFHL